MSEKSWKELKAKQKQKVSEVMFDVICDHYKEYGQMPAGTDLEELAKRAFTRIQGRGLGLSYETVHDVFMRKQARFAERIEKNGLPEPPKPKVKKTEAEKLALKRAARKRKRRRKRHRSRCCRNRMTVSSISPDIPPGALPMASPGRNWNKNSHNIIMNRKADKDFASLPAFFFSPTKED